MDKVCICPVSGFHKEEINNTPNFLPLKHLGSLFPETTVLNNSDKILNQISMQQNSFISVW